MTGARANSWPFAMKALLATAGTPVITENIFGDAATPDTGTAAVTAYEPRITFAGSSWSRSAGTVGGSMFTSTTGSDSITFTPAVAVDSFDIYYVRGTSFGTFTVTDVGGTLGTINSAGTSAFLKTTVTRGAASTNAINIQRSVAGTLFIAAIDCYNSGSPAVDIINGGTFGTTAVNQSGMGSPWSPGNAIATIAPDLTIVNLGINDVTVGTTASAFQTAIQTIITQAKLSGDAMLMWHHPNGGSSSPSMDQIFRDIYLGLARTNGIPMIDLTERFGSYAQSTALYYDTVHLKKPGYRDFAAPMTRLVLS